jgi:hypothetical protein
MNPNGEGLQKSLDSLRISAKLKVCLAEMQSVRQR